MFWKKPDNKSWTDLCKEFDKEFYEPDRDDTKLYKYMYAIYYMLACKSKFFQGPDSYRQFDEYAIFAATTIYMRYIKKEKEGERIKSILNYAKNTKKFLKIMFQNDDYAEVLNSDVDDSIDINALQDSLRNSVQESYNYGMSDQVIDDLEKIVLIIRKVVGDTPYKNDKIMIKRIYMSCLLSFLSSITPSNQFISRTCRRSKDKTIKDESLLKELERARDNDIILWHLDDSMRDYIKVLNNKVRSLLVKDISDTKSYYELPEDVVDSIIASGYSTYVDVNPWEEE